MAGMWSELNLKTHDKNPELMFLLYSFSFHAESIDLGYRSIELIVQ